jgi:SAM-dependent methyltransferase
MLTIALAGEPMTLLGSAAGPLRVPAGRWCGTADGRDRVVLGRCLSPTIDLGCGPGRMSERLQLDGVQVLGVDIVAAAVCRTLARGVPAIRADVLGPLPGEGAWATALLADGNIGIGGDPVRLLQRAARLLAPGGRVVADLAPPGVGVLVETLHLRAGARRSEPFLWARVGADGVVAVAEHAGLLVREIHEVAGRWFAVLVREGRP